jgi:toxin ParE1/3/4
VKISFSKSAIEDLETIKEYYLEQGVPQIGQDFVVAIIEHIETLTKHPDIGRVVPEFNDELIRELIHSPFRVVYLRESKLVNIIRIWRSERLLKLPEHSALED